MTEISITRLVLGLRKAGWSAEEINDFMMYLESGKEEFLPKDKS